MTLFLTATTPVTDLVIDFIEVKLASGKTVSLNWDKSWVERSDGRFIALYDGVCFGTKSAAGKILELKDFHVEYVGLYSETRGENDYPIFIEKMEFYDDDVSCSYSNVYTSNGSEPPPYNSAMQQLYNKFLASSRR